MLVGGGGGSIREIWFDDIDFIGVTGTLRHSSSSRDRDIACDGGVDDVAG